MLKSLFTIALFLISFTAFSKSKKDRPFATTIYTTYEKKLVGRYGFIHKITDSGLVMLTKIKTSGKMLKDTTVLVRYAEILGIKVQKHRNDGPLQGLLALGAIGGNIYFATTIAPVWAGVSLGVLGTLIAPVVVIALYQAIFTPKPELKVASRTIPIDYNFAKSNLASYVYEAYP